MNFQNHFGQPFGKKTLLLDLLLLLSFLFLSFFAKAQTSTIQFQVDLRGQQANQVAIKGSVAPLSWEKVYPMSDADGNGIYTATISFDTPEKELQFKFVKDGQWELEGADNRRLSFGRASGKKNYTFNEFEYFSPEEIQALRYTPAQIKEDVAILQEILSYIHPAIYQYRDSVDLVQDFEQLESTMLEAPNLVDCYKAISALVAQIKCSHTFTNPWNQSEEIKKAIFYQPDKLPFTFHRIGKRLFIAKNASENQQLSSGLEILSINGVATEIILTELARYVSSDGNNYEKKLERLSLTGAEKYAPFDIYYPIVFGSSDQLILKLKNHQTGEELTEKVKTISKTRRTAILQSRYGALETSVRDGWQFQLLDEQVGLLKIQSFSIHRNEFDWKAVIDDAFSQLNRQEIPNLIVDIRGNEGGQGEVGEYILKYVLKEPFTAPATESSVRYLTIPDHFRDHIGTWENQLYDLTKMVDNTQGDRYFLKARYTNAGRTYKLRKDAYQGEVYLLTDAANSSATHFMAAYAKNIKGLTLAGQETGGNQLGLNGSFMFFLNLPNTGIEVDIPIVHQFVPPLEGKARDGGIVPDIIIEKNWQDFVEDKDTDLEKVLAIIREKS